MNTAPDPHSITALRARHGPRYRWLLLLSVMLGTMASVMSSTIVNVAIPDMSHHFALGQERAQWATSGFMAAMTVSMLTTPWLLARYGYRATYTGCMWLLLAGGLAGGFAQHFPLVLAARVAEGLAAGVVQPIPAIIILRAFEPQEQGRASGIFGMGVVLAPALGPSIGGLLVDAFGWRSIFFMVVPFCLASLWMARRFVPTTSPGGGAANPQGAALDWRGLLLATAGTLCLLNGLVELKGGTPLVAAGLLGAAALAVVGFVVLQRRMLLARARHPDQGVDPLMNLSLFRDRRFAMGSVVAFIYGIALFGSTYLLPVYMQMGLGLSASFVGSILLPAGLVLAVTIALVGRLSDRQPAHRLVSIGLLLLASSFALMPTIDTDNRAQTLSLLVAWAILGRLGLGFILPSLNVGAMRGLDRAQIPQGASVINFLRMLGGAAGVSLCGIVLEWRTAAHGLTLAPGHTEPGHLAPFNETFFMVAAICALAIGAAVKMREKTGRLPDNSRMCQLLALNCATPTDASFSFTGFCQRGGATDHHADGWGIAFFEGRGLRLFIDHESAANSRMAEFLRSYPLKSRNIVAHVRKATIGEVALENAHPFTRELWGRHWVFAHNGDLKDYFPKLHSAFRPVGTTDSERAFCWLMQELAKSHASLPSVQELTHTLRELIPQVTRFGTFNFLLSNGEAMWAHCSTKLHYLVRQYPFSKATLMDQDWTVNFAEVNQPGDRAAVIVTTPLTSDEQWTAFEPGELKVFVDGVVV